MKIASFIHLAKKIFDSASRPQILLRGQALYDGMYVYCMCVYVYSLVPCNLGQNQGKNYVKHV